jgi:succinate dehydrogenase flavin-adding protein (antitoxin of CptAB toxin-antitoxin module)
MVKRILCLAVLLIGRNVYAQTSDYFNATYGELLPNSTEQVVLWWASSGWKISQDKQLPKATGQAIKICAARNEAEAAQLVIRPTVAIKDVKIQPKALKGPNGATIPAGNIEVLKVQYVNVTLPTDKSSVAGFWPDPLPPLTESINLEANQNQPFWIRVKVPRDVPAGIYTGSINISGQNFDADVILSVEVYDFVLPDRMTCTTAFGFSTGNVFRYQKITDEAHKRQVLEKYWKSFSEHHISPYDPAPLDEFIVTWPNVKPPIEKKFANWEGLRIVDNESHSGTGSLLIYDDDPKINATVSYRPLIEIPSGGLQVRFWYRTAVPDHRFGIALNHYDQDGTWMSGRNNDMTLKGSGRWQLFEALVSDFPKGAKFIRPMIRATTWTDAGELTGLVWFDEVSLKDAASGKELVEGGDFDIKKRTELVAPPEQLKVSFDFSAWDNAMDRAINHYHFNSFRLSMPGLGGGTFHAIYEPSLLGFKEDEPEYPIILESYCTQLEKHLAEMGRLDEAYVYWFDEPSPEQYEFVMNGFEKLKRYCSRISRMLTEQVEPKLLGGPNIWCPVSPDYKHEAAEQRRKHGDKFWWYVCTGPKAPYCTLFIDHPGTELRIWLWQSWQRKIEGILVWQTNYWTSSAAYPDQPQNPYEDPMGWTSGYSTPKGEKRAWGNGDGRFIYPPPTAANANSPEPILDGPVDSIRWEMLRDGIEDYEYHVILRRFLNDKKHKLTAQQQQEYTALLNVPEAITKDMTNFTKDPAPIEKQRDRIAQAIAKLNKL